MRAHSPSDHKPDDDLDCKEDICQAEQAYEELHAKQCGDQCHGDCHHSSVGKRRCNCPAQMKIT